MSVQSPEATSAPAAAGLTEAEARRRLAEFGPNAVADEPPSAGRMLAAKFWAPIPWLLEAAMAVQLGLGEYVEAAVIGGLLLFNAVLGFVQEGKANAALAALRKRLAPTALVRRDGAWSRRAAAELVPGDAVRLALGALVPADARIAAGSVTVDQSTLTGESVPVEAGPGGTVYAGALVRRGQAVAEVTATGAKTFFGRAAELVRIAHAASTEQRAILAATRNLAVINGTVAALIVAAAWAMALPLPDVVGLALTALLGSIPVALPATFTLSAAIGAQTLARQGVLLTRLSAAHEAAAIDVLCADKTGTLTRNELTVDSVAPMAGFDRDRVLALAALASSDADQDPIDEAIRKAGGGASTGAAPASSPAMRLVRFTPFDPATRISESTAIDRDGREIRIVKGAFHVVADLAAAPAEARAMVDRLAESGHRVIAVAAGPAGSLAVAGLIALSDPPRDDSAALIASLKGMGVRTVMVTGDSPVTAAAIARKVGLPDAVCPPERIADPHIADDYAVFARVVPEEKYRLVAALQAAGHTVGMCGDGANDTPALRQAQIGIAVSSATDVAKAAAAMVMTEPGLAGIVFAVREGRVAFQRLLTYTFNMLVKKIEIVLFLAVGLALTGHPVMTPVLMVLMLVTNDFLSMSLTADRASFAALPSAWRMRNITVAAAMLGVCKLAFSAAVLAFATFRLGLRPGPLQTLAFATLVFGNNAALYALRERRAMWSSMPSTWVLAASAVDVGIVTALALTGTLMAPLPWQALAALFAAAVAFAFALDRIKRPVTARFRIE